MPPRYAYWTILIDDTPTAFRAREREELQPTFVQLQRKNANVSMRWFARGKLWESREAERDDFQVQKHAAAAPREPRGDRPPAAERRGSDWRPGGAHKDPRDRFKKKNRPERAWSEKDPATQRDRDKPGYAAKKPWQKPTGDRPWQDKPREPRRSSSDSPPSEGGNDRPWQTKPTGPRAQRKPWVGKPSGAAPRGDRPPGHRSSSDPRGSGGGWGNKPPSGERRPWSGKPSGPPRERKPWSDKPAGGPPRGDRPWRDKPSGPPRGDRPPAHRSSSDRRPSGGGWNSKPPASGGGQRPWSGKAQGAGARKPWQDKPRDPNRKPFNPRGPRPGGPPSDRPPRKRRDDDPDKS